MSYAPKLNVTIPGDDASPGLLFISPWQLTGAGPYIYDKLGNLVWDGFGVVGPATAFNFHMCNYDGSNHLCATLANLFQGYSVGNAIIVDSDYRVVKTVQIGGDMMPVDLHEFQLVDGGNSALLLSYVAIPYDLSNIQTPLAETINGTSNVTIDDGLGWLMLSNFQEIDVDTGAVNFEWYSNDHVHPSEADVGPGMYSGDGLSPRSPWDYLHINSIDKSSEGHYIVSARHTSTIYYINGTSQNIIWRLNCHGGISNFTCLDSLDFAFQHDARIHSQNSTHTILSLFNNGGYQAYKFQERSSGMVIALDHATNSARTLSQQHAPTLQPLFSDTQGNTQLLPNGNRFHGWGNKPWISEHASDGTPLFAATYTTAPYNQTAMNYRAFSFEGWQSTPANTRPSVYSYAYDCDSANRIYVSWNGATSVVAWNYYGTWAIGGELEFLGRDRKGREFEHYWVAGGYWPWVVVEAVGEDGMGLRNSSLQATFVPSEGLRGACDLEGCEEASSSSS